MAGNNQNNKKSPRSLSSRASEVSINKPKGKENLTVTVRFRPLSCNEVNRGESIGWFADGDSTVRNEFNPNIAYAFDRVFGPVTTTHHVYDAAAHHVVTTAMQGINGTIFAYGVTTSGKTHTMHGIQKSPGIVPLAVKHVFQIIQETPGREFLLRISFLEIYNEVINDLLDPTAQNLRIREDTQGTYIQGIKEEVVLSPAHALSLIATGEENRHVGSNNFNLLSSRSHTIFTLTIESSPCGQTQGKQDVTLSQLHLIDLAGSESSKAETNGMRRKEGSYINKSLLTLGTVISKLTDAKATHIPYRDSKLTRLLQSSLSGHGRISLICTVNPASSNSEETHNTLKFASRSKHVEIKASQNKILDEKSLIKKYQREISHLKEELQGLKHGSKETLLASTLDEFGISNLESKLEEEEQAKAALNGRIQRLTKLILVSTISAGEKPVAASSFCGRGHSFCEDELAYLPDGRKEYVSDCDDDGDKCLDTKVLIKGCGNATNLDETIKDHRKHAAKRMLGWFKSRKFEHGGGLLAAAQSVPSRSPPSSCSTSSRDRLMASDESDSQRKLVSVRGDDLSATCSDQERSQAGGVSDNIVGTSHVPQTGTTIADQLDHLNEQVEHIAEKVGLYTSSLKRLSEQRINSTEDPLAEEQMQILANEIYRKKLLIRQLEQRFVLSLESDSQMSSTFEMSQALIKLSAKFSDKICELKTKSADNRILEEQLEMKVSENSEMQEMILLLRQQLCTSDGVNNKGVKPSFGGAAMPSSITDLNGVLSHEAKDGKVTRTPNAQLLLQADEILILKQENLRLAEEKHGLENHTKRLAKEASYAKELASAAAMELQHLTEKITKLSYRNAELIDELDSLRLDRCGSGGCQTFS